MATTYPRATHQEIARAIPHKTRKPHPWVLGGVAVIVAMVVFAALAQQSGVAPRPGCGARCVPPVPPPVAAPPLTAAHTYTSSAFGYALQYGSNLPSPQTDDRSIGWGGNGSRDAILFTALPANGQSPAQIVTALQQDRFPDATPVYQIPGAELGYVPGYGAVYDLTETPASGAETDERIAITAATHGNVTVVMLSASPLAPDNAQHPNPAQLDPAVAQISDDIGNTVTWKGMSPP
jgi:hypothetical protein